MSWESNSSEEDKWQGDCQVAQVVSKCFWGWLWATFVAGARLSWGSRCPLLSCAPLLVKSGNVSVLKNVISLSHSLPKCQAGSALLWELLSPALVAAFLEGGTLWTCATVLACAPRALPLPCTLLTERTCQIPAQHHHALHHTIPLSQNLGWTAEWGNELLHWGWSHLPSLDLFLMHLVQDPSWLFSSQPFAPHFIVSSPSHLHPKGSKSAWCQLCGKWPLTWIKCHQFYKI